MTTLGKFLEVKNETGITASIIAKRLNNKGKLPKTARLYTDRLVYNTLHNLCDDINIVDEINAEYSKIATQND